MGSRWERSTDPNLADQRAVWLVGLKVSWLVEKMAVERVSRRVVRKVA